MRPKDPPLPLGLVVEPWGEIAAVGYLGERYYWLVKDNDVAMLPESVVKQAVADAAAGKSMDEAGL